MQITDEQKNAIDEQIRQRILDEKNPDGTGISAIIYIRRELGAGMNLENACPYFRACESRSTNPCIGNEKYRECGIYRIKLASDILDNLINLEEAQIDTSSF